ncbi:MAG: metalloregulator ArsR/SmtB family transcription factor [Acidobacteriota bacterium]
MSDVFRALADVSRRRLLDRLYARNGQTLRELSDGLPMSRQAVAKHLGILEGAHLVTSVRRGREKLHYLNPVPIAEIVRRWVGKFEDVRLDAIVDFKEQLESAARSSASPRPSTHKTSSGEDRAGNRNQ